MAYILKPKCNFLHGFFRCHLPVEMVDVEVWITSMQGTHTFRRDRTCQIIKCNPWRTQVHPQDQQQDCTATHNTSQCPSKLRKKQILHKKVHQVAPPTAQKYPSSYWHPMAWSRKDVRKLVWVEEGLANPSCIHFKSPIEIEPQLQELATPNAAAALKAKKCGWGPNCPFVKI